MQPTVAILASTELIALARRQSCHLKGLLSVRHNNARRLAWLADRLIFPNRPILNLHLRHAFHIVPVDIRRGVARTIGPEVLDRQVTLIHVLHNEVVDHGIDVFPFDGRHTEANTGTLSGGTVEPKAVFLIIFCQFYLTYLNKSLSKIKAVVQIRHITHFEGRRIAI